MRFLLYFTGAVLFVSLTWQFFGEKPEVNQVEVNEERLPSMPEAAEKSSVVESARNVGLQRKKVVSIGSAALANREDLPRHAELAEAGGSTPVEAPTIDEKNLLKDAQGNLVKTSQTMASRICADRKMHLPSMRELALIAQSRGARGIMEAREARPGARPEDLPWQFSPDGSEENEYYLVRVVDSDGKQDAFYYNPRGYHAPDGALGGHLFLSSSLNSLGAAHSFGINAANGVLGGENEKSFRGETPAQNGFAFCVSNKSDSQVKK